MLIRAQGRRSFVSVAAISLPAVLAVLFAQAGCTSDPEIFGRVSGAGGAGGAWGSGGASSSTWSTSGSLSSTGTWSSSSSSASSGSSSSSAAASSSTSSASSSASSSAGPSSSGASSSTGTMCAHDVCVDGAALDPNCDPCVQTVCNNNPDCCNNQWTSGCVYAAAQDCGASCCGNGVCVGENCDSCAADCGACFCGNGECNNGESCGTCPEDCYDCPTCAHSVCTVSGALNATECPDTCVSEVCMTMSGCCGGPNWGVACQNLAQTLCTMGDPCVTSVCAMMPDCCNVTWSQACVDLAKTQCSTPCDCPHSLCDQGPGGTPFSTTCDPCVAAICAVDDYCCNADWDYWCTVEVETICFINCN